MLSEAIAEYVTHKRAHGIAFEDGAKWLHNFSSQLGDTPLNGVSSLTLISYLDGCTTTANAWHLKSRLFIRFFEFCAARDIMAPLSMPPSRHAPIRSFLPYVFKDSEVMALLASTTRCQMHAFCSLDHRTLNMLVLMLYATGAAPGELRRLKRKDVQLGRRLILLHNSRTGSRTIPIGTELRDLLKIYMNWRFARVAAKDDLFVTKREETLTRTDCCKTFARLCQVAGVERRDGYSNRPRLQDFRTTFAVHRITAWIKEGSNLNQLLPALASYMGRRSLLSGEGYLRLTPERFRKQLDSLSPAKSSTRWSDDPALMAVLQEASFLQ